MTHWIKSKTSPQTFAIFLVVAFVMLTANVSLFEKIVEIYPLTSHNLPFLISLILFFTLLSTLFFLTISWGRVGRWVIAILLILSAQSAYYMDQFGVLMDVVMMDNIFHTSPQEIIGLLNINMILRILLLGIIPAWLVIQYWPKALNLSSELRSRLRWMSMAMIGLIMIIMPFTAGYTSFIREHKITRFYANPTYPVYSLIKYSASKISVKKHGPLKHVADDTISLDKEKKRELIILVVGETARFDRFSLNGYHRDTNPRLSKENILSLKNVTSCGTSTGVSVPCMFSAMGREKYDDEDALNQENVLDVLKKNGIEVLWRDNNSDSKGVATRIQYQDFKSPTLNPVCEGECRDIGMLSGLDQYVKSKRNQDLLIVLHQMGNHGPEYYRRYPKEFQQFMPICMTGELRDCSPQEIDNGYDNAILYTDYFLSEVIKFLKKYDGKYETAMLYVSDHGESLGEHQIYLHAAPYAIAPKEQTHVPAIIWLGQHFDYSIDQLKPYQNYALSHDDLFCTLLTAYELESKQQCPAEHKILMQNLQIHTSHLPSQHG